MYVVKHHTLLTCNNSIASIILYWVKLCSDENNFFNSQVILEKKTPIAVELPWVTKSTTADWGLLN